MKHTLSLTEKIDLKEICPFFYITDIKIDDEIHIIVNRNSDIPLINNVLHQAIINLMSYKLKKKIVSEEKDFFELTYFKFDKLCEKLSGETGIKFSCSYSD